MLMNSGTFLKYYSNDYNTKQPGITTMRSNEYTRRRLRNKFTNPKQKTKEGQEHSSADDNLRKYHELMQQAEREQDPIEKLTLEQRAEYFKKLAHDKPSK